VNICGFSLFLGLVTRSNAIGPRSPGKVAFTGPASTPNAATAVIGPASMRFIWVSSMPRAYFHKIGSMTPAHREPCCYGFRRCR
jgi:hypothetical protein